MFGLSKDELRLLRTLNTPRKIQDFLNTIPMNFEKEGEETCRSPRRVLRDGKAHCMEGAMFAAAALRIAGYPPLVIDMKSAPDDMDHVIAVYKLAGLWGALSKTNHGVLRYREPVYQSPRELVMSYFHEYFLDDGRKTLRSYSQPVNLSRFDKDEWMTSEEDLWQIPIYINDVKHFPIVTRKHIAKLRPADHIERKMGQLTEWKRPK